MRVLSRTDRRREEVRSAGHLGGECQAVEGVSAADLDPECIADVKSDVGKARLLIVAAGIEVILERADISHGDWVERINEEAVPALILLIEAAEQPVYR